MEPTGSQKPEPHAPIPPSEVAGTDPVGHPVRKASLLEVYFPFALDAHRDAIYVASFPPIIYFWPTILVFYLCALIQHFAPGIDKGSLGWWAVTMFAFNILVIVQDFDQKKFLVLIFAVIAFFLGIWVIELKGFSFPQRIAHWLLALSPDISVTAYTLLATILLIYFCWGMIQPVFNYWRLEHNEFVHYVQPLGRDMSVPRAGSTVSKDNPDVLESILTLGGGSIIIKREGQTVATIPHVPFLGLRMKAIEIMLAETRVTAINE